MESEVSGSSGSGTRVGQLVEDESTVSSPGVLEGTKAGGGAVEDGAGTCPDEASFNVSVSAGLDDVVGTDESSSEAAESVVWLSGSVEEVVEEVGLGVSLIVEEGMEGLSVSLVGVGGEARVGGVVVETEGTSGRLVKVVEVGVAVVALVVVVVVVGPDEVGV